MIKITRLNNTECVVNADLIVFVEATPDTVIRLTTGEKILVRESVQEIVDRVLQFTRASGSRPLYRPGTMTEAT